MFWWGAKKQRINSFEGGRESFKRWKNQLGLKGRTQLTTQVKAREEGRWEGILSKEDIIYKGIQAQ